MWHLTNKTRKQNITRDIEIKNKLTVTRGEVGGDNGNKGKRVFGNMYKGPMDKSKMGKDGGWEVGVSGPGDSGGRKMETTIFK